MNSVLLPPCASPARGGRRWRETPDEGGAERILTTIRTRGRSPHPPVGTFSHGFATGEGTSRLTPQHPDARNQQHPFSRRCQAGTAARQPVRLVVKTHHAGASAGLSRAGRGAADRAVPVSLLGCCELNRMHCPRNSSVTANRDASLSNIAGYFTDSFNVDRRSEYSILSLRP